MNAQTDISKKKLRIVVPSDDAEKPTGLALMREPFPANQISKLPTFPKWQTDALKADRSLGVNCKECGQWHHKNATHLDYVGHAALTDRLLDCDPSWNWTPVRIDEFGAPVFDQFGGMWINLTVCGETRMGYGFADGKQGGNAIKETIGDALRNAAMRFGAALDLWHKGELHAIEKGPEPEKAQTVSPDQFIKLRDLMEQSGVDEAKLCTVYGATSLQQFPADMFDKATKKLTATIKAKPKPTSDDLQGDKIPY